MLPLGPCFVGFGGFWVIAGLGLGGWEGLEEWFWGSGSRLDSLQLMVCGVGVRPWFQTILT